MTTAQSISFQDLIQLLQKEKPQQATNEKQIVVSEAKDITLAGTSKAPHMVLRCNSKTNESGFQELACDIKEDNTIVPPTNEMDWLTIFQKYKNSVVQVLVESVQVSPFSPFENLKNFQARGSGLFISKEGHIITNSHVDIQGLKCHIRRESEGERFIEAQISPTCPLKDVALLKISPKDIARLKEPIVPFEWNDSDLLPVGSEVAALGFQLGMPDIKYTIGTITGYHREADDENRVSSYLQISSAVNSGSSGGPLVDKTGRVVGIVSAGIPGASAYGFSIPSKVAFSTFRPLFSNQVYTNRIVPIPCIPVLWQTTNRSLLSAQNVDTTKYMGGLYVTRRINPYMKRAEPDEDLQHRDVIVEIRCSNPYTPSKKYLDIDTYRNSNVVFPMFPHNTVESKSLLITEEDGCTQHVVIKELTENKEEETYLNGGTVWNLPPSETFPAYKVTFQQGDETITIFEKKTKDSSWELAPLYINRKMFISDFLDLLPMGIPLVFVLYRNGKKVCLERRFSPVLPRNQGLQLAYPPFQDYKEEYEIFAGLVFMNLKLNHFTQFCIPHLIERLEGKKRFEPAVIVTHLFNLSSVSRMGIIEPFAILYNIELFGPEMTKNGSIEYKKIFHTEALNTIEQVRKGVLELVLKGIDYYTKMIGSHIQEFKQYLHEGVLRGKIHALRESKKSFEEIDQILSIKYKVKTSSVSITTNEQEIVKKFLPLMKNSKAWNQLLSLAVNFHHGISLYVGFPNILIEDFSVQHQSQIPLTRFAQKLYQIVDEQLVQKFNILFQVQK